MPLRILPNILQNLPKCFFEFLQNLARIYLNALHTNKLGLTYLQLLTFLANIHFRLAGIKYCITFAYENNAQSHSAMTARNITPFILIVSVIALSVSCRRNHGSSFTQEERHAADSIVKSARGLTALDSTYKVMDKEQNVLGKIVALREMGKRLRNESRFDDALKKHGEGLQLAEEAGDTLEWVQALNNIGTDYRRMGILDAAQQYHQSALQMAEECADTSFTAKKNRVVSLNGLANVYLTINNLALADSTLRLALAGEKALHSLTGQAINYANLGSIFETRGKTDSAWTYYRKAMELNQKDSNSLGIALCHTYFGDLHAKTHQYDKALEEYNAAYGIMKESKDEWHTLNTLTALAGIYIEKGNNAQATKYLEEAKSMATKIESTEHLAEIYTLYYKAMKQGGNWQGALEAYEHATELQNSLIDMEKVNRMQSISFNIERGQQSRRMTAANNKLRLERSTRYAGYIIFGIIAILLIGIIALLIHARRLRARSHAALKKLNAMRESFFTNITHEFRTPLTVILGLSHDLRHDEANSNEVRETGATIERQGTRMLHLINQLLDISKMRSAIGQPEWRSGNIVAYIGMIMETFDEYAQKRGVKLQFIARESEVETDFVPDYTNKVVSNLLSNALKFTPEFGKITVSAFRKDEYFCLDVADTGRGIPATSLPHIFEPFYQSDNTAADNCGSGVGLALVDQIIKSLGGTISAESTEGKGTTFHIVLPIKHDTATAAYDNATIGNAEPYITEPDGAQPADATEQADACNETSILIIEDNADVAAFIGKRLGDKHNVLFAPNGEQGLAIAKEKLPDAIVTDLMMPQMDGIELTKKLRADVLTCHIPIIIVTAKVTEKDRITGLEAGADAYMTKPFNSDELLTRVDKLLEQRRILRQKFSQDYIIGEQQQQDSPTPTETPARPASPSSQTAPANSPLDLRFINRLTDSIYLLLNANKPADVNAVAEKMNMSYSQLYRKLSTLTGMTPVQYIQRVKVAKAKRMLRLHPEKSLNFVAEQCGFSDYSNFVRAFRNVLNQTPTQYIRNIETEA